MSYFKHLEGLNLFRQSKPFPALRTLKWRADQILKRRSYAERESIAEQIQNAIDETKEEWLSRETEKYIKRLSSEGGWELDYLPEGSRGTEDEISELINNWPSWADDSPDLPSAADMSDLEALHEASCNGYPFEDWEHPHFEAELYAVLALMKLDDVAWQLGNGALATVQERELIVSACWLIEATEIVCYAERELSNVQSRRLSAELRERVAAEARKSSRIENARLGGLAKHANSKRAKEFVIAEWATFRDAYEGNKSAFARDYVRRVKNELDVTVTEKQMREVWLKDPLSASKKAG